MEVYDAEEAKTEKEYHLKCKVLVKDVSYLDEQSKGSELKTEQMIFLIPQESTQRTMFLNAWLPDTVEEHHEVVFEGGYPVEGIFKGAVQRRNERCSEHHIFVMSRGAEEDLKAMNGKFIQVKSLPASNEHLGDTMKDFDLADNKADSIVSV